MASSQRAKPLSPEDVERIRAKGNDAFKREDFVRAIELYTEAGDAKSIANRAQAYNNTQQYRAAIRDCASLLNNTDLPTETMDKVLNRLGFALFECATKIFEERDGGDLGMDLYRTAAYYYGRSGAQSDPVSRYRRVLCYRILQSGEWGPPAYKVGEFEGLPLISELRVCMLCWGVNDNTRLVRSNLAPNSLLNARCSAVKEGTLLEPFTPESDREKVSRSLAPLRHGAPEYSECMNCVSCDEFLATVGEDDMTAMLLKVHDPLTEHAVTWGGDGLWGAVLATVFRACILTDVWETSTTLVNLLLACRATLLTLKATWSVNGHAPVVVRSHVPGSFCAHLDVDSNWPLYNRWFRVYFFDEDNDDFVLHIQLGLLHLVVTPTNHEAALGLLKDDGIKFAPPDARRHGQRFLMNSFLQVHWAAHLRNAEHALDLPTLAAALQEDAHGKYIVQLQTDDDGAPVSSQFMVNANMIKKTRLEAAPIYLNAGSGKTVIALYRIATPGYSPTEALIEITETDCNPCSFGDTIRVLFVIDFRSTDTLRYPSGPQCKVDDLIAALYLNFSAVCQAMQKLWERANRNAT